ncbi:MAG: hypothetical protein Q4E37_05740 [Tissierellia bacterium]|nr:hypothetical protein [Tissierellia bacterium]
MNRKLSILLAAMALQLSLAVPVMALDAKDGLVSQTVSLAAPSDQPSASFSQEEIQKEEVKEVPKEEEALVFSLEGPKKADPLAQEASLGQEEAPSPVGPKVLPKKAPIEEAQKEGEALEEPKAEPQDLDPPAQPEMEGPEEDPVLIKSEDPAPKEPAEGPGETREAGGQGPQLDPNESETLKDLQAQIDAEKDQKKKAALQKQYNESYYQEVVASGREKLDETILGRFTDKVRTEQFYDLQAKYEDLQKKVQEGKLSKKDVEDFNQALGAFNPPRALSSEEQDALDSLHKTPYIPGIDPGASSSSDAQAIYEDYDTLKKALEEALNPEVSAQEALDEALASHQEALKRILGKEDLAGLSLADLKAAFEAKQKALIEGIQNGTISPNYTQGQGPEVQLFPYVGGKPTGPLAKDQDTYYVPDNTSLNLMVQVNKDKDPQETFKVTIRPLDLEAGVDLTKALVDNLHFLNYSQNLPKITRNEDGSYSFETDKEFGIAQLNFNMPGFSAAFHTGFELTIEAGETSLSKKFLITKKGYEDSGDLSGIGSNDPNKPTEHDGGETQDHKIVEETDRFFNIYNILKKSNGYIDEVIVNSPNGQALPLSSVEITLSLPDYNGKFAEFIQGTGLAYEDLGSGKYRLSLALKDLGGNLETNEEGQLLYKGQVLSPADLKDVILENGKDKVYVDEAGEAHKVTTEIFDVTQDGTFKIEGQSLYKKNPEGGYDQLGTFVKGKLEYTGEDGKKTVYELKDGQLISYTATLPVYEGQAANKDGKADPTVTPAPQGQKGHVIVTSKDGKKSYGGTLVKDGIYNAKGSLEKGDYQGLTEAAVDTSGKFVSMDNSAIIDREKKTVTMGGKSYRLVENAVFNTIEGKPAYIMSGFSYQEGYSLVDKFGRKMAIQVTYDEGTGHYTFKKEGQEDRTTSDEDLSIDENTVFVDTGNQVLEGYEAVGDRYYYDGKKFVAIKDGDTLKGNILYQDYQAQDLDHKVQESYTKDNEKVDLAGKKRLSGSTKPEDYVQVDNTLYVKKGQIYLGHKADGSLVVLSQDPIQGIVQKIGGQEILTQERDIFQALRKANFKLRFPGFLAGKDLVYRLHGDLKAKYLAPKMDAQGKPLVDESGNIQYEEKSIFRTEEGLEAESKAIDKYFTLKIKDKAQASFFKNPPKEFSSRPDYNFFNIFYREANDRDRDAYLKTLLELKEKEGKTEAEKDQVLLLDKIQKALGDLYQGAQFELKDGQVVISRKGQVIDLDRSLIWEVGFNNPEGVLFPEGDGTLVMDDTHMDNRLVYDEIILNDSKAQWQKAKEAWEQAQKEAKDQDPSHEVQDFTGSDSYFYLDQIDKIILGVNPSYKDKVFTSVGEDFILSGQEILEALKDLPEGENQVKLTKGEITYTITRDPAKGQVRIKVFNAFYTKADAQNHKFQSPVQKAYQDKIQKAIDSGLDASSKDSLKKSFEGIIDKFYTDQQDCYGVLQDTFNKMIDQVEGTEDEQKAQLEKIKAAIQKDLETFKLAYLDPAKGDYQFDDMSFNAIRFILKANTSIGGAMDPVKTKKLAISSVLVPDVDIPFTDEFGQILTNRDKYLNQEIEDILKNGLEEGESKKTFKKDDFQKKEEVYREVMAEANRRVNAKVQEGQITIKDLVEVKDQDKLGLEKYGPKAGKAFAYGDLAGIKDSKGKPINPWYVDENTTIEGKLKAILTEKELAALKANQALYDKYVNQPIDLAGYYMSQDGANRRFYGNQANYFIVMGNQAPGIFGREDQWTKKICRHGILGHCIYSAGGGSLPGEEGGADKDQDMGHSQSQIEISYSPSSQLPDQEKPKLDKEANKNEVVLGPEDQKVDFTIKVSVDKLKKEEKEISDALSNKVDTDYTGYNDKGYFVYKDALIIDVLPEIFKPQEGTSILVELDEKALKAGGANQALNMEDFKAGIKTVYTEDVWAYLKDLEKTQPAKAQVLKAALEGRVSEGTKEQAILAWLPEFEAPHGSKDQIQLSLSQLLVDKDLFKDYADKFGEIFTNEAIFGIPGDFLSGKKDLPVREEEKPRVNKYLQVLDKDGNVIDADKAEGWFKGSAMIHFGDSFNYKISVYHDNGIFDSGLGTSADKNWQLEDLFKAENGLRPVLRDFVQIPEGTDFVIIYRIGDRTYTEAELKEAIDKKEASLDQVTGLLMKAGPKGFPNKTTQDFILPMMIPELDAKIQDGKLIYIASDGQEKVLGEAKDFFNLEDLKEVDKDLLFKNQVDGSNTVTIKLEKEGFIKLFKEFLEADGKTLINENRPEVTFDIIQQAEGQEDQIVGSLVLNEDNHFQGKLDQLPLFKKTVTIDEDGKIVIDLVEYTYSVMERAVDGYTLELQKLEGDDLGFVIKAQNTKKPHKPGKPEEPGEPPLVNPPSKPGKPSGPQGPGQPGQPGGPQRPGKTSPGGLPKTGLVTETASMLYGLILLAGLVFLRRRLARG